MSFSEDFTFTRGTGATRINAAGLIVGVDFSSTSNTIGTGAKTFTLTADANVDRDWPVGSAVRVVDQVSANTMEGTVTTYTPSTQSLVLNIATVTGSGTFTNWRIGSLEVRRDADGVLREPMRSNIKLNIINGFTSPRGVGAGGSATATSSTDVASLMLGYPTVKFVLGAATTAFALNTGSNGTGDNLPVTSGATYSRTIYFRKQSAAYSTAESNIQLQFDGTSGFNNKRKFLLSSLTENSPFYVGNGWYRLADTDSVTTSASVGDFISVSYLNGTSSNGIDAFYFTLPQTELGSVPTSVIPTTTVAVTRNADTFTFTPAAIAKFRQGQGALVIEANASDAGTAQRAALRLTGPAGEIRFGKQGVATSGNFTKMAEGGDVQLLGNATQGITNNGLEYGLLNPINTRTGVAAGAFSLSAAAFNESAEFGLISGAEPSTVNSAFTILDGKGLGNLILSGAHHNGSRFLIATNSTGIVGISTDGLSCRRVNTPVITQPCNEVTSGMVGPTLRNVIVGAAGFIATSDDNGETWTSRTSGTTQNLLGVSYGLLSGTNYFVIAGNSTGGTPAVLYSTDGITYAQATRDGVAFNNGVPRRDVHVANGVAVLVGNGGAIDVSTNGTNFVPSTSSGVVTTQTLTGVHYNASANLWVAVGAAGTIITATDPSGTWTLQTSGTTQSIEEVNYFNGLWIAVGAGNTVLTSPNATTWTSRTANIGATIIGIAASGTRLIITGSGGGFASSEDGLTYTSRTNNNATLNGIAYGAGVYVSVGNAVNGSGYIATIDGAGTVTRRVSGLNTALTDVKYLNGAFYISHGSGLGGTLRSVDGITWTDIQNTRAAANRTSVFGNGIYLFLGNFAIYNLSTNGTSVTSNGLTGLASANVNGADFANGVFVIVADGGRISTTTDGVTYTLRTSGTTQNLTSVIYSQRDQRWYAAGNAGTLLYSEDNGVTWASVNNAGFGAVQNTTLQASKLLPRWKTGRNTMALSYKANEVIVGLNGVAVTDTANTIPSITAGVLGETFNGKIGPAYFYEFPKTLAEIIAITGVTR